MAAADGPGEYGVLGDPVSTRRGWLTRRGEPAPGQASPDEAGAPSARSMLEVRDLRVHFPTDDGLVKAVDGLSFRLERGRTLGIVGESGSGKSVTSLAIMGMHGGSSGSAGRSCSTARTWSRPIPAGCASSAAARWR